MEKKFEYIENMSDKLLVKCYCPNEKKIVVEDGVTIILLRFIMPHGHG